MKVLALQIFAGLTAWLVAGFGVTLLFKMRILGFQLVDEPTLHASPAGSPTLPRLARR